MVRSMPERDPAYRPTRTMTDNHELRLQSHANMALWPIRMPGMRDCALV